MKTFGNIVWTILIGWWLAFAYLLEGILFCLTIVLIPAGLQMFKIAGFFIWPLGTAFENA